MGLPNIHGTLYVFTEHSGTLPCVSRWTNDTRRATTGTGINHKEVKRRAKRVKEELGDVADAARNLTNQTGDVVDAVKGKPRKGRKPKSKK